MNADREVDLLIAGAGPSGMTAALVASLEGLDVLICEKTDQVGGTGSTSAGTLWIPGNTQSKAAGFNDSAADAERYLDALIPNPANRSLRTAFLQTGPKAIDYLSEKTDVQFVPCGKHPDYRSNMPGAAITGRAIVPKAFDGRLLGSDFKRIRPPIPEFMLLGGMMVGKEDIPRMIGRFNSVGNFLHAAKIVTRYFVDRLRYPRGTRIMMGNALIARLFYSLRKRGVPILYNTTIAGIEGDRNGVTGARITVDGKEMLVRARKGVVLATGGYAHNKEFRAAFMPQPVPSHSLSHKDNQGDGIAIGQKIGARIAPEEHLRSGLWTPVSILKRKDGSKGLYPHLALDRAKPGLIAVNSAGRRFVNEAASYHDFVEGMFDSQASVPSIPAYLICDANFIRKYGLGAVYPGASNLAQMERTDYLLKAPTLDALASRIGIDAKTLRDTVARYNSFAETGVDVDFGKGETELNRFNGDPNHKPNPCVGPLTAGPFYAVAVYPADIAVSTGLSTDADARVLAQDGKPIPGLYACGNDMASLMSGAYPGPGTTLGPGMVFAYRAAMHARDAAPVRA